MKNTQKFNPPFATKSKNALTFNAFPFLNNQSDRLVPRIYSHYRPPKLKKGKQRWYIEYWYRVPEELKHVYPQKWRRFRITEDLNYHKTEDYAQSLLKAFQLRLQEGYNPFEEDIILHGAPEKENEWSLNQGLEAFMEYCKDKKLRPATIRSYQTLITFLKEYFTPGNKLYATLTEYTKDDLKQFIRDSKKDWSNHTTNNYITYTKVIFNWFAKEDVIVKSPAAALEQLPVNITRHKYYSDEIAEKLKSEISKRDPELYEFLQITYYCGLRPKETRMLRVEHILFDRQLLFVPWNISKNKTDDYIPLGEDILSVLETRKEQPKSNYIFGGSKPRSTNYFANHFKPYKDKFGLGEEYTLYGFKHTRAIHLAQAGADPYQIMRLMRHSSLEITMKYLRGLGISDFTELHAKTKKF